MKKVLLTGTEELLGANAIESLLNSGFEVFAVTFKDLKYNKNANWIQADLFNFKDVKNIFEDIKPEYLLHLAWITESENDLESNLNFNRVQIGLEMLKQFKLNGGKRAVYAGTYLEYGTEDVILNEYSTKINPISTYAKCKNYLNELATLYAIKNDISFGWGRIFNLFGENDYEKKFLPKFIASLVKNREVIIKASDLVKDFMAACDTADAFVKFLNTEDVNGCVNICLKTPLTYKDITITIGEKLNKKHLIKFEKEVLNNSKKVWGDNKRLTDEVKYSQKQAIDIRVIKMLASHDLLPE